SLVSGFYDRFVRWPSDEPEYLSLLYTQNWGTFTVAGHAYLHVSYDLPVVIADTLPPKFQSDTDPESQTRAANIYLSLEKAFRDAVQSNWDKPLLIKFLLWRPFEFDLIFLGWLIELRRGAWIHAEMLSKISDEHRARWRLRLHQAMLV